MPVYNQERYVADAVKSILQQTFTNFELIVVADGSTDRTIEIAQAFADFRIRIIRKVHTGFITTLVKGYQEARGKWIARMDSDDICRPERLKRQMDFLENHSECTFVGSAYGFVARNSCRLEPRLQSLAHPCNNDSWGR